MNILHQLQQYLLPTLGEYSSNPVSLLSTIRATPDPKLGDYQANFCMALAKQQGCKPAELAAEFVSKLPSSPMLAPPEIAGPGFINFRIRPEWIAEQIRLVAADDRLGVSLPTTPRRYVIDYSSVNVAKPMHVGHLRSTIIGDCLARLLRFLGHFVVADNHLGDWGTQFGMLIYGYKHYLDEKALAADPVRELARLYVLTRKMSKDAEDASAPGHTAALAVLDACRQETAKLHAGDPENLAIWQRFMPYCLEEIEQIYARLGVRFDEMLGESFYNPMLPSVLQSLVEKGVAHESRGALVVKGEPELPLDDPKQRLAIVRKSDGAFTYMTTDLATIRYRVAEYQPDALLYVVDSRQADHFKTLFITARLWGYDQLELSHISFGSVLGKDRKPLKSRDGGVVELEELLDEAIREGARKYEETRNERLAVGETVENLSDEAIRDIAEAVGIGAVKYADLSQNRNSDYVYDLPKMLATDGNTATYMQYAYTRCRGIFRAGGLDAEQVRRSPPAVRLVHPSEVTLALKLLQYPETLAAAAAEYLPHILTAYLWDVSRALNGFYRDCSVLKAESQDLHDSRLVLVDLTARILRQTLYLLGIRVLERM